MLGLLTLDTAFPRIPGDLGSPDTFPFPVRIATVRGARVEEIVHRRNEAWLGPFSEAIESLADAGCTGVATTCGFLVRWQAALARASRLPVLTSSLLQLALVQATLPGRSRVGVVTYSARDLDSQALHAAGVPPGTPVEGVPEDSYFATTIRHGAAVLDRSRMQEDTVAAARRLLATHAGIGAIVLECANMPPYRIAVADATGLPVFDAAQLVSWFHAGTAAPLEDAERARWA
jgi:hypothetical protein